MIQNRFYDTHDMQHAELRPIATETILALTATLPQRAASWTYALERTSLDGIQPMCTSVTRRRFERAQQLLISYERSGAEPFWPVELHYKDCIQTVFPPVVLRISSLGHAVVLDGTHRVYAAMHRAATTIHALVITTEFAELPAEIVSWSDVRLVERNERMVEKFVNLRRDLMGTPLTVTLNGEWLWRPLEPLHEEHSDEC